MKSIPEILAEELGQKLEYVQNVVNLMDEGNTIPFIARYRKEATGSMDDQVLRDLGDRLEYLRGLDKRKDEVTSSITEQGAMTPEIAAALDLRVSTVNTRLSRGRDRLRRQLQERGYTHG